MLLFYVSNGKVRNNTMKLDRKKKSVIALSLSAAMLITGALVVFSYCRPSGSAAESAEASDPNGIELYFDSDQLTEQARFASLTEENTALFPKYDTAVQLAMADGPGKPLSAEIMPAGGQPTDSSAALPTPAAETALQTEASSETSSATSSETAETAAQTTAAEPAVSGTDTDPTIIPMNPTFVLPTSTLPTITITEASEPLLTVLTPVSGEVLQAGQQYTITWKINSERNPDFVISLSTDNGTNFSPVADGIKGSEYIWTVPDVSASGCILKVYAVLEDFDFGNDSSDVFAIAPAPTPVPTITPTPTPTPTPAPTEFPYAPFTSDPDLGYRTTGNFFISSEQDSLRWFLVSVTAQDADTLIWQVSKTPFTGLNEDALTPPGLLVSGELDPADKEFSIDFAAIVSQTGSLEASEGPAENTGALFTVDPTAALLEQSQYSFYVRVIAVDSAGKLIGDAGEGMETGYGIPAVQTIGSYADILDKFHVETWTAENGRESEYGETGYQYLHKTDTVIIAHPEDQYWDFRFRSTPENTRSILYQVASSPFGTDTASVTNPQGLVYSAKMGEEYTYPANDNYWRFPLKDFVPAAAEIGTGTNKYYVRAVFMIADESDPSIRYPVFSETQAVFYNNLEITDLSGNMTVTQTQKVEVKSYVPFTQFIMYMPVQWEHPDSEDYYEVTRRILPEEMEMTLHTPDGTIYPYAQHVQQTGITRDEYQALLDRYLPVGASFKLTIKTHWYDEFTNLLSAIYNSIREAYNGLQDSAAELIADNIPLIGDKARDAIKTAIKSAIQAGLTSIGLPPTLPDFETMAADGFDYCLQVAIQETCQTLGVPENELTKEIRDQVTGEVTEQMKTIASMNHANPLDVDYLKPASAYRYRPAYFTVFVQNCSDQESPSGSMLVTYDSCTSSLMDFYKPVRLPIPALQPGDYVSIKYYWKPNIGTPVVDYEDNYKKYYFGNGGDCEFRITAEYNVPDVKEAAGEQGLTADNTILCPEYVYDHSPVYAYSFISPPCEIEYPGDETVDIMDFWN